MKQLEGKSLQEQLGYQRKGAGLDERAKLWLVLSMIALLVGASCARVSQKDQGPPRGEAGSVDRSAPSGVPPAASSVPIPQPPASNDVSAAAKTDSQRQSLRRAPARTSDYIWSAIDINSGDLRRTRAPADQPPQYDIYETGLSRELRRLGIPIPEQRQWMRTTAWSNGRMHVDYVYRNALPNALDLLRLLEEVNASDEQRRDVLQRLMTIWQTGASDYKVQLLMGEVGNRHGLYSPSRPFGSRRIEELRYLSSE